MNAQAAEEFILGELRGKLSGELRYHGIHHTLDVAQAALKLAALEGIKDNESLILLKTAALYHDCGFMNIYKNHEEEGCLIAKNVLPEFDYNKNQIEIICGMIMATKIPQSPATHLEKILCDADLDYLGREDYEPIAMTLFRELQMRDSSLNENSWNEIQVRFLRAHQYWTASARKLRNEIKQTHLAKLEGLTF